MKKLYVLAPAFVLLAQCNLMKKTGDTAGDGGVATADTTSTTGGALKAGGELVSKAMSFLSGGPFEGEITMNMINGGKPPETIVYMVKGQKMRFDAPSGKAGGGYVIFDSASKKMMTVTDSQKMAMTMDLNNMPQADVSAAAAAKKSNVDKTGKTDTVAGYSCDIWKVTEDSGDKTDLCVGKGIAFPSMGKSVGWMSELSDSFPLRAVTTDATGKEKTRMEVTKIDKKSIDDSKFEVPAGYKTMSMDDMMKGMGGMGSSLGRPHH